MQRIQGKAKFFDSQISDLSNLIGYISHTEKDYKVAIIKEIIELPEDQYRDFTHVLNNNPQNLLILKRPEEDESDKISCIFVKKDGQENGLLISSGISNSGYIAAIESLDKFMENGIDPDTLKNSTFTVTLTDSLDSKMMKIALPCHHNDISNAFSFVCDDATGGYIIKDIQSNFLARSVLDKIMSTQNTDDLYVDDLTELCRFIKQQNEVGRLNFQKNVLNKEVYYIDDIIDLAGNYRNQHLLIDDIKDYIDGEIKSGRFSPYEADILKEYANHIANRIYDYKPVDKSFYEDGIKEVYEINNMYMGYSGYGDTMQAIDRTTALKLFNSGQCVHLIIDDDTDRLAENVEDIESHTWFFGREPDYRNESTVNLQFRCDNFELLSEIAPSIINGEQSQISLITPQDITRLIEIDGVSVDHVVKCSISQTVQSGGHRPIMDIGMVLDFDKDALTVTALSLNREGFTEPMEAQTEYGYSYNMERTLNNFLNGWLRDLKSLNLEPLNDDQKQGFNTDDGVKTIRLSDIDFGELEKEIQKNALEMTECIKGLKQYTDDLLLANAPDCHEKLKEIREMASIMEEYWSIPEGTVDKIFGDEVSVSEEKMVKETVTGLFKYAIDMVYGQGLDATKDIEQAQKIMNEAAKLWDFDSPTLEGFNYKIGHEIWQLEDGESNVNIQTWF